jgi:2-methylcitrate dehydratase PrpD
MTKSFHPGRAAQNGLPAALLAAQNFTSSEECVEAKRGWTNTTDNLGETYEISFNTYKPFACEPSPASSGR